MSHIPRRAHALQRHLPAARGAGIVKAVGELPGHGVGDARRVDQARYHAVGADTLTRVLLGDHARELHHGGLGHAVRQVRIAQVAHAGHRRDRDDGAAPALHHRRQHLPRRQQQAAHVDAVGGVEVVQRCVERPSGLADADVMVQHVNRPELLARLGKQARHVVLDRHVANEGFGHAAFGPDQRRGFGGRRRITVSHADPRPQPCVSQAGCPADAPAGPRRAAAGHKYRAIRQAQGQGVRRRRHA